MNGFGSYASEGQYWCSLCNAVHTKQADSNEAILKTGWRTVDGTHYNIGFCNGTHRKDSPKYVGGQGIIHTRPETAATFE